MTTPVIPKLKVLLFKEEQSDGCIAWISQCIDYDIVASGNDPKEAEDEWIWAFIGCISVNQEFGRKPFEGLKPAPDKRRENF